MKISSVTPLSIPDVLSIRFARFIDERGYFSETWRAGDFDAAPGLEGLRGVRFLQCNESFSKKGVARGFHFQWDPPQGKLVRVVRGRMIDMALDIRKGSPSAGKVIARDMSGRESSAEGEWLWLPPGFAHGVLFLEDTTIEYFCTAAWNPAAEASLSLLAEGLDWSLCDPAPAEAARSFLAARPMISAKDREGVSYKTWAAGPRFGSFSEGRRP